MSRAWCNDCGEWGDHPTFEHREPEEAPRPTDHRWDMGTRGVIPAWEEGALCLNCDSCGKKACCAEADLTMPCPGVSIDHLRNAGHGSEHSWGQWIQAGVLPDGSVEWVRQCLHHPCQAVDTAQVNYPDNTDVNGFLKPLTL